MYASYATHLLCVVHQILVRVSGIVDQTPHNTSMGMGFIFASAVTVSTHGKMDVAVTVSENASKKGTGE